MYLSGKGASSGDKNLGTLKKAALNPNATEFVPFALRSPVAGISSAEESSKTSTSGKAILDVSESSVSHNSDDEAQQYWSHQLPDDITPDFKAMGLDDNHGINSLSLSSLSLNDINEGSRYATSTGTGFMSKELQGLSPHPVSDSMFTGKLGSPLSSYGEYPSPTSFHPSFAAKPWDQPVITDQLLTRGGPDSENPRHSMLDNMSNEQLLVDNTDFGPLEFLASQFPGFAAESLAEVYFANAGNLNLTIEVLTQLELQVDGGLNQTMNAKTMSSPSLTAMDFPALSMREGQNDLAKFASDGLHQNGSPCQSSEKQGTLLFRSNSFIPSRGATDFASAVRKMPSQDSGIWRYDRNGSPKSSIGSSRNSQALASSYNTGQGRGLYSDRLRGRESAHASSIWLETGEAVANMYSDMREEARGHARIRNAYFEQARQAYLIGNKALAKELSIKGQLHNMQMKAAHEKAQEAIYRQRNSDIQTNARERMIDLHGLHVSEAIHVLKRELAVMRNAARSMDQRLLVYICVGTGHHTRGSRTPARLPIAVQRYLLEEGLDFSEPQPGLLRVIIY
ncbi:polyadenylate-binding protein-interacting protein 7-like [Andrographis paniculata]|uniref:polyadenylate-binding protein-interacting protein 7-like n=1 Tax=Andrographis paniculata TaxID=175694 RepID=UPI0021E9A37E|nr:polyadenylate-binding protein-interacting protein 7-like [Andrographis paniculata]XP_051119278.1 polyadenylate-binding protein-interacting protein 7-like [Andrographis paniculata]XP_051119279.1 polyadenylate-binding protein-interacting protein 7-like [Andrographis paniculata]XP_051119280.1 polyadenylate-binding protein-interacting protein 7-like [Andrographis paniculata]XP_051119281.1 polyadenylate-binding protein-interacting protein 7-like [Andrographis paniculata]